MSYRRPVEAPISKPNGSFRNHRDGIGRKKSVNPGTDYAIASGNVVVAPESGKIAHARSSVVGSGSAGRFVVIYHDDGYSSDILHLARVDVQIGQRVSKGQRIGVSGASANGKENGVGAHVHWTLRTKQVSTLSNAGNIDPETKVGPANPWSNIAAIQTRLNVWLKHYTLPLLKVDNVAGPITRAAIRLIQNRMGLTVDGLVGPQTWTAISRNPPALVPTIPEPVAPAPEIVEQVAPEPAKPVTTEPAKPVTPEPTEPVTPEPIKKKPIFTNEEILEKMETYTTPNVVIDNPKIRRGVNDIISIAGIIVSLAVVVDIAIEPIDISAYTAPAAQILIGIASVFGIAVTRPNYPKLK